MMRILYDFQAFAMQKFGGISRYFYELLGNWEKSGQVQWKVAIKYSQNEYLENLNPGGMSIKNLPDFYRDFLGRRDFRGKWKLYQLKNFLFPPPDCDALNKEFAIKCIQAGDYDLFHPTYYDDYFLECIGNKPFVVDVHDMVTEVYPEYFELAEQTTVQKRRLMEKATGIIAVSEFTRRELIEIFGTEERKITVIPRGDSCLCGTDGIEPDAQLPLKYLLFVGARAKYKNFYFFIRGVKNFLAKDPELRIICTGSAFTAGEIAFFRTLGIENQIMHYAVNDSQLSTLYKNALALVFPSLYEGFGLPILEAFSCGCPVILSRAGAFPEVGGDAAVYFEPKSVASLREAVSGVIYNQQNRNELIERGRRRLKQFSWEKTAGETRLFYEKLAGK